MWRRVLVVVIACCVAGIAFAQDWREFRSDDGGFVVQFPREPKTQTQPLQGCATCSAQTLIIAEGDNAAFLVGYFSFEGDYSLDKGRDGALAAVKGTLRSERKLTIGGAETRDFIYD